MYTVYGSALHLFLFLVVKYYYCPPSHHVSYEHTMYVCEQIGMYLYWIFFSGKETPLDTLSKTCLSAPLCFYLLGHVDIEYKHI